MALGEMRCCKGSPSSLLQQCRESQHGCPGAWWGLASGWQPEDAVLLRSSFLKTCLAPLTGKEGFKWPKLGVWVKEKKSLKWYNEQWVGLEGLFLLENQVFSWNGSEFCSPQRGAWEGEARSLRAEQERQTKRKSRQCFVPPRQGTSPQETRQHFLLLSLPFAEVSCWAFSIPYSF